jgi:hypothetical protein
MGRGRVDDAGADESSRMNQGNRHMKKAIPESMFADRDQGRLTALNSWVLDNSVTEIVMKERQFWNFAFLQPLAEKPWTTFMGRPVYVPDMPEDAQRCLGLLDPGNERRI